MVAHAAGHDASKMIEIQMRKVATELFGFSRRRG